MNRENIDALYDYAYGITTGINYRFRTNIQSRKDLHIARLISELETLTELPTLYRATLWKDLTAYYGLTRGNINSKIGEVFTDYGFMSTSIDREVPPQMYSIDIGTVFMTIRSTGKHRAINVNEILGEKSPAKCQKEILLGKGTKFIITQVANKKGITYIDVELKS